VVICLERGANDLYMVQLCHCHPSSLAPVRSRMVYLFGAGLPMLSWKKAVKRMYTVSQKRGRAVILTYMARLR